MDRTLRIKLPPTMADFTFKPTLTGDRVVLRPFTPGDIPVMQALLDDPELRLLTGSTDLTFGDVTEWYATRNSQTDRLDLAVTDRQTGECVGEAVLNEWSPNNRSCSFRIAIGPAGRGRGLGTEAVRLIVGYGFEQLGLHRISLEVYAFNPRARHVYEKVGFTTEGVLRDALHHDGAWVDATVMSILAPEWARLVPPETRPSVGQ
jgi:RimJ/RimL family protein N-acetyltransferase